MIDGKEENKVKQLKKFKIRYLIIVYTGFALSIVISYLIFKFADREIAGYLSILTFFMINALFLFVFSKQNEDKYNEIYDELIIRYSLDNKFQDAIISYENNNIDLINQINLFLGTRKRVYNFIECMYNKIPLTIVEAEIEEKKDSDDIDRPHSTWTTIFNGQIYKFNINNTKNINLNIVSKYYLEDKHNNEILEFIDYKNTFKPEKKYDIMSMYKEKIESNEFCNWFSLYSNYKINQEYLVKNLLPALLKIRKSIKGKLFLAIQDDEVYLGINEYHNFFRKNFKTLEKSRKELENHFDLIKNLIDCLINFDI